jgi:hypothetical protein
MSETTWRLPKGAYQPAQEAEPTAPQPAGDQGSGMNDGILRLRKLPEVLADMEIPLHSHEAVKIAEDAGMPIEVRAPDFWSKGALLNVRNAGTHYNVTLYPEEYDPRHPERALQFTNTALCQDFVSHWYAREHFDPRAR